ncbi:ferritin-like domain-containing protein [Tenggerimyces flavus]|uniref:Ferritin-like domain-containing protein n=1 Tax=Tenggerimyces flavus TaxID=1708749 RepID=A0ABV7YEA2_9ACTN|nr:ferritin-like domain-containing protein [Tenggerimyces flavus]MBM7786881.1 hypothetical protein [Tenggerimyces flavus]
MPTEQQELDALQAALEGEHASVWAYGVLGPRLGRKSEEALALSMYGAHRVLRDSLAALVQARGSEPAAAAASYTLPFEVDDRASARTLALRIEERSADLYGDLVAAATTPELRAKAATALAGAELRRLQWGGTPHAFPGMPERRTAPPTTPPPTPTSPPPTPPR